MNGEHVFVTDTDHRNSRTELGRRGETFASNHLRTLGFTTIARNQRTRYGEIDLIAFDGTTLVFAEVKTLRSRGAEASRRRPGGSSWELGWPAARQRRRLRRVALEWLSDRTRPRPVASELRFDVLKVLVGDNGRPPRVEHVKGAC